MEKGNREETSFIGVLGVIKKGLEKYVDRIPGTTSSPHPQRSVKQARGYNNSIIIMIIMIII